MTISVIRSDMTGGETPESGHDFNFYLDRQFQNKLIEQDEILVANELNLRLNGNNDNRNGASKAALTKADAIIGWIYDSKLNLRKPEKESQNNKNTNQNGYQAWKEARNKQTNVHDSYTFKHYYDTHGYIEQYRRDHTNVFIYRTPSSIQNMQGEGVSRYGQQGQRSNTPSQISQQHSTSVCSNTSSSTLVPNYTSAAMQYTNRCNTILGNSSLYAYPQYSGYPAGQTPANQTPSVHTIHSNRPSAHGSVSSASSHPRSQHQHTSACKKHKVHVDSASQAYKYKLAPETYWGNVNSGHGMIRSDSQTSVESDKTATSNGADIRTPPIGSGKGGKPPTKVSVPVLQNQIQTVSV